MTTRAVHWHEGMFLRPHHLQTAQRQHDHVLARNDKWSTHYNWGLRSIDLDPEGLANYRLVIRALAARLRDGATLAIPEDGLLPAIDLKPAFEEAGAVTVYLAVPQLHLGRANASTHAGGEARYLLDTQELED